MSRVASQNRNKHLYVNKKEKSSDLTACFSFQVSERIALFVLCVMPEMTTFDALIAAGYMRVKFSYCLYFKKKCIMKKSTLSYTSFFSLSHSLCHSSHCCLHSNTQGKHAHTHTCRTAYWTTSVFASANTHTHAPTHAYTGIHLNGLKLTLKNCVALRLILCQESLVQCGVCLCVCSH